MLTKYSAVIKDPAAKNRYILDHTPRITQTLILMTCLRLVLLIWWYILC